MSATNVGKSLHLEVLQAKVNAHVLPTKWAEDFSIPAMASGKKLRGAAKE